MSKPVSTMLGRWRITTMELWDADNVDMEVPAYFLIHPDLSGEFQFGMVQAQLDGKLATVNGKSRLEFTWSGFDENHAVNGRGWLEASGTEASGRVFIHLGDDSGFAADRA